MEIRLPEISSKETEAIITAWHVAEESRVSKDQDLLEVSTDKATFDIPSPCDGVLVRIVRKTGDTVLKDEVLAEITKD